MPSGNFLDRRCALLRLSTCGCFSHGRDASQVSFERCGDSVNSFENRRGRWRIGRHPIGRAHTYIPDAIIVLAEFVLEFLIMMNFTTGIVIFAGVSYSCAWQLHAYVTWVVLRPCWHAHVYWQRMVATVCVTADPTRPLTRPCENAGRSAARHLRR